MTSSQLVPTKRYRARKYFLTFQDRKFLAKGGSLTLTVAYQRAEEFIQRISKAAIKMHYNYIKISPLTTQN